jgi:hypothetical protein
MAYRAGAEISGKEFALTGTGYYSYAGSGYWGEKGDDATLRYRIQIKMLSLHQVAALAGMAVVVIMSINTLTRKATN